MLQFFSFKFKKLEFIMFFFNFIEFFLEKLFYIGCINFDLFYIALSIILNLFFRFWSLIFSHYNLWWQQYYFILVGNRSTFYFNIFHCLIKLQFLYDCYDHIIMLYFCFIICFFYYYSFKVCNVLLNQLVFFSSEQ